jgi:hypothetical protein
MDEFQEWLDSMDLTFVPLKRVKERYADFLKAKTEVNDDLILLKYVIGQNPVNGAIEGQWEKSKEKKR